MSLEENGRDSNRAGRLCSPRSGLRLFVSRSPIRNSPLVEEQLILLRKSCYLDLLGTQGVARMRHDFANATVELFGAHNTICGIAAFNDKKLDVMVRLFRAIHLRRKKFGLSRAGDSFIVSDVI